jgi:hypothetical protein
MEKKAGVSPLSNKRKCKKNCKTLSKNRMINKLPATYDEPGCTYTSPPHTSSNPFAL